MDQASELFKSNEDHILLQGLRTSGIEGECNKVEELSVKFEEHIEQLEEVSSIQDDNFLQLMLGMFGKIFSRPHTEIFFLFFP